ncbi:hypothetical protein CKF46_36395, partial [Klebsiella pneumoniae]
PAAPQSAAELEAMRRSCIRWRATWRCRALPRRRGETIRPAILWNETRCAAECGRAGGDAPELHQVAGNLAMPGFTAPK